MRNSVVTQNCWLVNHSNVLVPQANTLQLRGGVADHQTEATDGGYNRSKQLHRRRAFAALDDLATLALVGTAYLDGLTGVDHTGAPWTITGDSRRPLPPSPR